jgi:hypothetical protein
MTEPVCSDLPLETESARRARELLEPFRGALGESSFFDLRLLISELVVEALNAEPGPLRMRLRMRVELRQDRVHAQISADRGAYWLPSRHPQPGEPGWALYLVRRLSSRWGVRREPERSLVWLEMPQEA